MPFSPQTCIKVPPIRFVDLPSNFVAFLYTQNIDSIDLIADLSNYTSKCIKLNECCFLNPYSF